MTLPVQTLDLSGQRLAYRIAQPARTTSNLLPVLAIHGWGASSALMEAPAEQLAARGHTVYALDMPGFGDSPHPGGRWTVHDYAQVILQAMDALQLAQVHYVGHSFGGRLGLLLAAEQPARIAKMALANSAGVPNQPSLHRQIRLRIYRTARHLLERAGARPLAQRLRTAYNARYGSADLRAAGPLQETLLAVVGEDMQPFAQRVLCPTLLFWGDADQDTPLWQGKRLEALIPDAGLIVYSGAGHYSYLERLPEFVHTVDHFFRQEAGATISAATRQETLS
jgi:pimeloyl-ACP methyl ester carboxylesterase